MALNLHSFVNKTLSSSIPCIRRPTASLRLYASLGLNELTEPLGTDFNEIQIQSKQFSFKNMNKKYCLVAIFLGFTDKSRAVLTPR